MPRLSDDDRRALVESNLKYAWKLAARFRGLGVEDEDLDQVAVHAMLERAREFDPTIVPPDRFGAFCHVHIVGRLRRAVTREARRRSFVAAIDVSQFPAEPDAHAEESAELSELVRAAVEILPTRQRRIVEYRFGLDGQGSATILETARHFRCSAGAVKRALTAAGLSIEWALKNEGWNSERASRLRPETFINVG